MSRDVRILVLRPLIGGETVEKPISILILICPVFDFSGSSIPGIRDEKECQVFRVHLP